MELSETTAVPSLGIMGDAKHQSFHHETITCKEFGFMVNQMRLNVAQRMKSRKFLTAILFVLFYHIV